MTVVALLVLATGAPLAALPLPPATLAGWAAYISSTERRIERELTSTNRFLAQDFAAGSAGKREALQRGAILVDRVDATGAGDVPSALVHHWRGAVLIPGAKLADLLAKLQSGVPASQDVLESRILERQPDRLKVFLRVQRTKIVTVVYNTEHTVTFRRYGSARASSTSTATKIAEVESPGTSRERELEPGDDRGFLWRLQKDGRSSWLYGTLHVARLEWVFPGPLLTRALRQADTIALELDMLDPQIRERLLTPPADARPVALPQALSERLARQIDHNARLIAEGEQLYAGYLRWLAEACSASCRGDAFGGIACGA